MFFTAVVKHEFVFVCVANFEAKYILGKLGEGSFGSVYAGYRKTDDLPVSITNGFSHPTYTHSHHCCLY